MERKASVQSYSPASDRLTQDGGTSDKKDHILTKEQSQVELVEESGLP